VARSEDTAINVIAPALQAYGTAASVVEAYMPLILEVKKHLRRRGCVHHLFFVETCLISTFHAEGHEVVHTCTRVGKFDVRLTVEGADSIPFQKTSPLQVTGKLKTEFDFPKNRRYVEGNDPHRRE